MDKNIRDDREALFETIEDLVARVADLERGAKSPGVAPKKAKKR